MLHVQKVIVSVAFDKRLRFILEAVKYSNERMNKSTVLPKYSSSHCIDSTIPQKKNRQLKLRKNIIDDLPILISLVRSELKLYTHRVK